MNTSLRLKTCLLAALAIVLSCPRLLAQAWEARHGLTAAQYQTTFDDLTKKGYRPKAISGYTDHGAERYEGLWVKTSGPAWEARHGLSSSGYQTTFDDLKKKGYRPVFLSGYGVGASPKFAGIWEKNNGPAWEARHNLTAAQYQTTFNDMKNKGYHPEQVCGYTVGGQPYFAAIWDKSSVGAWEARHNLTAAQYQSTFDDLDKKGYVLHCVSGYNLGGTDYYAAVWEKKASPLWWTRHGIPAMNYQHHVDNMYYQGYYPVYLNAFASSGGGPRYNVIWNNVSMKLSDVEHIDDAATGYMKDQHVNGLSLAVTKNGRLVFAKSYGYANKGTGEELSPNHSMRIMSVSKGVTGCGVMKLWEQDSSILKKKVFGPNSLLGSKFATPASMPKLNNITLEMLLWHTSGLRSCNGESVFWDQNKSKTDALNALLAMGDLIAAPKKIGDTFIYSNTNYLIASLVIEKLSGLSYENWIRSKILTPSGVGDKMYVGNANGESKSGECVYNPEEKMNLQEWAGFGGWVARPMDLVKYLAHVDGDNSVADVMTKKAHDRLTTGSSVSMGYAFGWNVSGDRQNHNGCFDGTRSFLVELADGLSYAVIINNNPDNDGCGWTMKAEIEKGLAKVSGWPSYNLF
jgi:CubicO group peptidase (beta-lactamase class C family)